MKDLFAVLERDAMALCAVQNAVKCLQIFSKSGNEGIKMRERERGGGRSKKKIQFYEN
jgi:hypothetical protein